MEKLLTVNDVAEMLSLSKFAVYDMVYKDKIPYVRLGSTGKVVRFDRQKINAWLNKNSCDKILLG